MLFLELGCKPLRDIIRERRLSFFHYILNEKKESTINRFLWTQIRKCSKKDWVTTVFKDLNYLDIECSNLEVIKNMKKETFMKIVKTRNEIKSFVRLEKTKETHSKVNKVKHDRIIMQKYLKASNIVISKEITQQIFKIRCRVTDVKTNFKGKYDDMMCRVCKKEEETQKHILECEDLNEGIVMTSYENIMDGNIKEMVLVASKFMENMKKLVM